jgi:hypothetical protein
MVQQITPPPIPLGSISIGDVDKAFGIDATANMAARGTTISSIGAAIIARQDGVAISASDLTVGSIALQSGGLKWTFVAIAGTVAATYFVSFPLSLGDGSNIVRTSTISVAPAIG